LGLAVVVVMMVMFVMMVMVMVMMVVPPAVVMVMVVMMTPPAVMMMMVMVVVVVSDLHAIGGSRLRLLLIDGFQEGNGIRNRPKQVGEGLRLHDPVSIRRPSGRSLCRIERDQRSQRAERSGNFLVHPRSPLQKHNHAQEFLSFPPETRRKEVRGVAKPRSYLSWTMNQL
jgi:hypothetical protein